MREASLGDEPAGGGEYAAGWGVADIAGHALIVSGGRNLLRYAV